MMTNVTSASQTMTVPAAPAWLNICLGWSPYSQPAQLTSCPVLPPRYSTMCGSASTPTSNPPAKPATPCVWNTPSVSSTFLKSLVVPSQFHDIHTRDEATAPMIIAPKLLTKPAAGVMATRPLIIPFTAPRNVGLRCLLPKRSQITQVSNATAVARLVLIT